MENLSKLEKKAKFQIHNYFPPPKIPFVLNLASQNNEISNLTLDHIDYVLECCLKLKATYYSFHAGFLCDLNVNELGQKIKKRELLRKLKSKGHMTHGSKHGKLKSGLSINGKNR